MASSDIYEVKESPWAKKDAVPVGRKGRRHRRCETFDEVVNKNLSLTHRRRSRNSGFRRFRHRLKDPVFSRNFWVTILAVAGFILVSLLLWDSFFRYSDVRADAPVEIYRPSLK